MYVSPEDDYHVHIGSKEYFEILFDDKFKEIGTKILPVDFLKFQDQKKYSDRLKDAQKKTNLKDAIRVGYGKSYGKEIVIACMDFKFIIEKNFKIFSTSYMNVVIILGTYVHIFC